jgi:hypothetical protein
MMDSKMMLAGAALLLAACLTSVSAGSDLDCTPGHDETCSEQNLHGAGTCRPDGTCACSEGYWPDARGKCVPTDAGAFGGGQGGGGEGGGGQHHHDGGFFPWDGGNGLPTLCSQGCAANQICVHPSCGNAIFACEPAPDDGGMCPRGPCSTPLPGVPCACTPAEPYCLDIPAVCDGGATCGCFANDPCSDDSGKCSAITDAGLQCVPGV